MIINALLTFIFTVITFILGLIPALPPVPEVIQQNADTLSTFLAGGFGIVIHIFGSELTTTIVVLTLALLAFDQLWLVTYFILKKLKIVG